MGTAEARASANFLPPAAAYQTRSRLLASRHVKHDISTTYIQALRTLREGMVADPLTETVITTFFAASCLLPFAVCCSLPLLVGLLHATNHTPQATRHTDQPPTRPTCRLLCLPDRRLVSPVAGRRSPVAGRRPALVISPCGFLPRSTHRLSAKVAQQKQFDRPKHPSTPVTDRPTAAQLDSPRPRTGTGTRTGTREDIILARVCPCCARYRVRMLTMWQACLQRRQFVSESESGMKRG